MLYVLDLWREWKEKSRDPRAWQGFAQEWVQANYRKTDAWAKRRNVSQFLSKSGTLVQSGYLTANDLFGVIPEFGRLLAVLRPIEIEIQNVVLKEERASGAIARWDNPFPKWEFQGLWPRYHRWFRKNGESLLTLSPIDWSDPMIGITHPS